MAIKIINPIVNHVEGGGASFNIHYGLSAPEDTSMLWVETDAEPTNLSMRSAPLTASEGFVQKSWRRFNGSTSYTTVDGIMYHFYGSYFSTESTSSPTGAIVCSYNIDTDVFTELLSISSAPSSIKLDSVGGVASVGKKVYLFGGKYTLGSATYYTYIQMYDIETNAMSLLQSALPTGKENISCASVGTKIYLFGGQDASGCYSTIHIYDTEQDTISDSSVSLAVAQRSMGCAVVGTKIYLFGGANGTDYYDTIQIYDTEKDTISPATATLPLVASATHALSMGTKIYLFGGYTPGTGRTNTMMVYDTQTDTISILNDTLPSSSMIMCSGVYGTSICINSGYYYHVMYMSAAQNNTLYLIVSDTENIFALTEGGGCDLSVGLSEVQITDADGVLANANAYLYNEATSMWELIS